MLFLGDMVIVYLWLGRRKREVEGFGSIGGRSICF